jgi:hypothetical protein
MKKSVILFSAALLTISSVAFSASLQSLSKSQVTQEIQGKTVKTVPIVTVNDQLMDNTFTGYFDKNGQLVGQLAVKPDGVEQTDQGTWTVKNDGALCATWQHWNQGKSICVSVFKLKNGMLLVNQQTRKIETVILDDNIKDGNQIG